MEAYENFGEETKCTIDEYFEISTIMKDYYENIVGVEKQAEQRPEPSLYTTFSDMMACCTCD